MCEQKKNDCRYTGSRHETRRFYTHGFKAGGKKIVYIRAQDRRKMIAYILVRDRRNRIVYKLAQEMREDGGEYYLALCSSLALPFLTIHRASHILRWCVFQTYFAEPHISRVNRSLRAWDHFSHLKLQRCTLPLQLSLKCHIADQSLFVILAVIFLKIHRWTQTICRSVRISVYIDARSFFHGS